MSNNARIKNSELIDSEQEIVFPGESFRDKKGKI